MKVTPSPEEVMTIELAGAYAFAAPPQQVQRALHDATLLAAAMPDCEHLVAIRPDQYLGRLRLHAGPIQTALSGTIFLKPTGAPHAYQITAQGGGDKGAARGHGRIWLTSEEDKTILHYRGEIAPQGELVKLGPDFLQTTARAIIRQNLTALARHLAETAPTTTVVSTQPGNTDSRLRPFSPLLLLLPLGGTLILLRALYRRWLHHLARRVASILAEENGRV